MGGLLNAICKKHSRTSLSEVITGSQIYKPGDGIIGVPTNGSPYAFSVARNGVSGFTYTDKTEGSLYTRTYKNIVQNGSTRYNLKMTAPSSKSKWITEKFVAEQPFRIKTLQGNKYSYTWYVTDASGNPIDWTGYFCFWDFDKWESIHIPSSAVLEETYIGSKIKDRTSSTDWSGCTRYIGSSGISTVATVEDYAYNDAGCVLKIRIPSTGLNINIRGHEFDGGHGGNIHFPFLQEYVNMCSIDSSGKWE